jgi:hypothetical protein
MKQFTFTQLSLLHVSVLTRIQRVESLIDTFLEEEDQELIVRYTDELNQLKQLKTEINEIF